MKRGDADDVSPTTKKPRRTPWWCDIRWIAVGVFGFSILSILWPLFGPEPAVRVSTDTTVITEPLDADGLPDYPAALLAMAGPAPPPEENPAVLILRTLGPVLMTPHEISVVCPALGMKAEFPGPLLDVPYHDAATMISNRAFRAATQRPWTGTDLPELEVWLIENERLIDQLVVAASMPRYWFPSADLWREHGGLPIPEGHDPIRYSFISDILKCRAMWHVGKGQHAEAWRDIHAIYGASRLIASPERGLLTVSELLNATTHQAAADTTLTVALLAKPGLTRELLSQIRHDLEALGPPRSAADEVMADRLATIDAVLDIVRRTPGGRGGRAKEFKRWTFNKESSWFLWTRLDWNEILALMNDDYDHIEAALRLPTFAERKSTLQSIQDGFRRDREHWNRGNHRWLILVSLGYRSRFAAVQFRDALMAERVGYLDLATRSHAEFELSRTALALAEWRLDHGYKMPCYPDRLDELVPKYLPAVPIDPFADMPLVYERRGDGYVLASVGQNGVYDGGLDMRGWIAGGEWYDTPQTVDRNRCDHVIRMPVPDRPFVLPAAP